MLEKRSFVPLEIDVNWDKNFSGKYLIDLLLGRTQVKEVRLRCSKVSI